MIACPVCGDAVVPVPRPDRRECRCGGLGVFEGTKGWEWAFVNVRPCYGMSEDDVRAYCRKILEEYLMQEVLGS